jgi:hypothetical protein
VFGVHLAWNPVCEIADDVDGDVGMPVGNDFLKNKGQVSSLMQCHFIGRNLVTICT